MESDTDSDSELPPGWEKRFNGEKTYYVNHFNKVTQAFSPLNSRFRENGGYFKSKLYKRKLSKSELDIFVQKFDSFSTAEQVIMNVNLINKYALVIGGCSGIGLEIVFHLISKQCFIIIGIPDVERCRAELIIKFGLQDFQKYITIYHLDLTKFVTIKSFCNFVFERISVLDMIIMCAGVMSPPYQITIDGFESTFQINVLSQYYIIEKLLSKYGFSKCECRVIWISCESHRAISKFSTSDLNPSLKDYNGFYTYALCSLCKIILIKQFKNQWETSQCFKKPIFYACHPGNVVNCTKITRYHSLLKFMFWIFSPFTKSLSQAASTPLMCCISTSMKKYSGLYFNNGCICDPSELANDEIIGKDLCHYLNNIISSIK